ncbi:hypothetical protein ACHAW6_011219 [Cyclotella cf. meneghiniana]
MPTEEKEDSSLLPNELMLEEMRQRRQPRISQMGEPVPRRIEKTQHKPAVEWTKAILMSFAAVSAFTLFAWSRRTRYLARKTSDFKSLDRCNLETYPAWNIHEAQEINLSNCNHIDLPDDIETWSKFKSLKKLDLGNNSLEDLPMAMETLAPSLEILFLSENKFNKIPAVIKKFDRLRVLSMRGNFLTELTSEPLPISSLVWLILTNNQIAKVDENIKDLKLLRKLMLSHNVLDKIPVELGECKDLELIRMANNNLETIPNEVLSLPKLAWISLSGNPIFASKTPSNGEKVIKEQDVEVDKSRILGKGASGTVFAGRYEGQDVAVKVFKEQSKGSDGNPEDEMAINSIVDHPFAISAIGVIEREGKKEMMVMKLLKGTYPLGKVPSFDTVTRDAGPSPKTHKMDEKTLMRTIWTVVSALEYIHSSLGVSHGDVYLHNVLINDDKVSRISDWGASFAYDRDDIDQSDLIEKIEVLAFGRLVDDLVSWHSDVIVVPKEIQDLLVHIVESETRERPNFRTIKQKLSFIPERFGVPVMSNGEN